MKKLYLLLLVLAFIGNAASGNAQDPAWTNDTGVSSVTDVYTANGRPGVTSAFLNNKIWVAYTSTTCSNGCAIKLTYSAATLGTTLNFSTPSYVSVSGVGDITSNNSPALIAQNGRLYLAYNDASNTNWLTSSADGVNWSAPYELASGYPSTWAPSLAADSFDSNRIYAGYASSSTYTPVICAVYPNPSNMAGSTQTCSNFSSLNQMNFNPGMISYPGDNSGVVMAYEWRGNSHCLYGYVLNPETGYSTDLSNFSGNTVIANCGQQTSAAPSFAYYPDTDRLFLAWGGNNSGRAFNTTFTDPNEFDLTYKQTFNQGMNGSPDILAVTPTGYYPELVNFYVWNGQLRYLSGTY